MFFPLRLALPVLLLFMQLCPVITGQSIPPDPEYKDTSTGELSVFAIDADPSSATMLPPITTSDKVVEPRSTEADVHYNNKNSSVGYVVVFKNEEYLHTAISEIQQNRVLFFANISSSIPRFNILVVELSDESKEKFVQKYSEGIKDVCVDNIEFLEDGKCIIVSNYYNCGLQDIYD